MDDKPFASISGAMQETAEPGDDATPAGSSIVQPSSTTSKPVRESSALSISTTKKLQPKRNTSTTNSPLPSRESSPVRPQPKSNISARSTAGPGRSRKNSTQDISPSRSASTTANPPSAAALQRALSAATTPNFHAVPSDITIKTPLPQKSPATSEIKETPRWPISPRLRSPPPASKASVLSPRKAEQEVPAINVQRTSPSEQQEGKAPTDTEVDDSLSLPSGMRTPGRGVSGGSSILETVQEISQPSTPGLVLDGILEKAENDTASLLVEPENAVDNAFSNGAKAKASNESGSDSGGKGEIKMRSTAPPTSFRPGVPAKAYSTNTSSRGKPSGDGSTRNMTVETETVSSIPQIAVGGPGTGNNGSIRAKPSSETIRPKKEKKKAARKAPSVTSGMASSKADIFEAKVASAVDEADSSDSEETFVYESNPPDTNDRPRRFHSRTPSATSMASQVDQRNGARAIMDGGHSVAMKKSMKFANSYTSDRPEAVAAEDDGKGTVRSNMGTGRGTTHHHHIGRWGRNGGNGHQSLFDNESPFPNASKSKSALGAQGNTFRQGSRPSSPRVMNGRQAGNGKKQSPNSSGYDLDDGADDERTPLMGTVRSSRSGRSRRPAASSMRQLEHQASRLPRSMCSQFAGCLALTMMIIVVVSGAVGFMFATTQPLTDVKILALKNVLASEQEVIFDIQVQARNPNLMAVSIDMADVVVFAKSKYAGTDHEWWKRPHEMMRHGNRVRQDSPSGPPPGHDDPNSNPNLPIGHIYALYSPLTFDASPLKGSIFQSVGQIRVDHPGNKTNPAGSERWGRVVQHEFDLIVRGTLKYSLALSQKVRSISVEGRVTVEPNAADQDPDLHIQPL